jgi:Family of unknown function (DUF6356)
MQKSSEKLQQLRNECQRFWAWISREENRAKARGLGAEVNRAFTTHPQDTGETYWEHLWFTLRMSSRFLSTTIVILIHGIFPFLLMREGSEQIEKIYRIIKQRIPKSRRDAMDEDYHV